MHTTTLLNMPIEVLSDVFDHVTVLDLYLLLQTCPHLHWIVINTACVKSVNHGYLLFDARLPLVISKLKHLCAVVISSLRSLDENGLELVRTLPKSLETLELQYDSANRGLIRCLNTIDHFPFMVGSPSSPIFVEHFHNLKTLILGGGSCYLAYRTMSQLPQSLTDLELHFKF